MLWESAPTPQPTPRPRRARKTTTLSPEVARTVGEEILAGALSPAEWATALAKTGTNEGAAVAEYARQRIDNLHRDQVRLERRTLEMEMRKRHFCGAPSVNVRRSKFHHESPSFLGIGLTLIGLWGLSAGILSITQTASPNALIFRSAAIAVTISALFSGVYFLTGKSFRRIVSGDRALGIGAILCGLSLALALRGTFLPNKPQPIVQDAEPAVQPLRKTLVIAR